MYFTWLKDGNTVSGDNVKVTTSEQFSVLQVLRVSATDVGNYTCFAKNLQGSGSYSVKLEVRAPPRWLRVPSDVSALLGSEAKLSCPVAGYPTPKVTWSKMTDGNRARLEASQSVTLDPSGVLVLHSVQPGDRGVYLCEADNGVGEPITNRVRLALNGKAPVTDRPSLAEHRDNENDRKHDAHYHGNDNKRDPRTLLFAMLLLLVVLHILRKHPPITRRRCRQRSSTLRSFSGCYL